MNASGISRTQRRINNMKELVKEIEQRDMLADEIGAFLKFTPSGVRKYIRDLRDAGVIELARYVESTPTYIGKAVYALSKNAERVKQFMSGIEDFPKFERKCATRPRKKALDDEGRHFHILADDTHYSIRIDRTPVMRDELVAALFGPARQNQIERQ